VTASRPILYLNPTAQLGGAEHSVLDLAAGVDRRRYEPHLLCLGDGPLVAEASVFARSRGQGIGFVVVTEIAPRQGHLAQVAVLPAYQRQGVGRRLVQHCLTRLATHHFDTLSLIVSRANQRAFRLYQAMGLQEILAFPIDDVFKRLQLTRFLSPMRSNGLHSMVKRIQALAQHSLAA